LSGQSNTPSDQQLQPSLRSLRPGALTLRASGAKGDFVV
jgi:hypothetical protein